MPYYPNINVTVSATDAGSGLQQYNFAFRAQVLTPVIYNGQFPVLGGGATEAAPGVHSGHKIIGASPIAGPLPGIPSGQYDLLLQISDFQNNVFYYDAVDLQAMGYSASMLVTGGSPDTTAPTCTLLSPLVATPSTTNPSIISFDGAAFCSDDANGVGLGAYAVIIQGPGPNAMQYTVQGSPGIPAQLHMSTVFSLQGVYQISGLLVWDMVGNVRGYGSCAADVVNMYQTTPGLSKFQPTICDLSFPSDNTSVIQFGWLAAIVITGTMFFCVLILSINQCRRDGLCDCCCSCCSCCYRRNTSGFDPVKFGMSSHDPLM